MYINQFTVKQNYNAFQKSQIRDKVNTQPVIFRLISRKQDTPDPGVKVFIYFVVCTFLFFWFSNNDNPAIFNLIDQSFQMFQDHWYLIFSQNIPEI